MATMNITLLITLILYAYRFVDEGICLLLDVNYSDAPRVGYTTYMDWWFYPILYYLCFALYEFILVQVPSDRHRVEVLLLKISHLQSLIGNGSEIMAKNVEFFSRVRSH